MFGALRGLSQDGDSSSYGSDRTGLRGIMVSFETVRPLGEILRTYDLRRRRPKPHSTWHLDEVFIRIDGRWVMTILSARNIIPRLA